jgi:predicted nucleic acid-binding protein
LAWSSARFVVMRRAVLDSNGVDPLVDLPGAFDLVKEAIEAGKLELLSTHVLAEEITATRDPIRRAKLQALVDLTRMVTTGAFIFDISQLDQARLSGSAAPVQALQAGNPAKNSKDALIGATAFHEQCALITSDQKLRREAKALGIEVLHARELLTELGYTGDE